jgi:hypothetical protein
MDWKRITLMTIAGRKNKAIPIFPCGEGLSSLVITPTYTKEYDSDLLVIRLR